jgi:uncharacterized protein
MKTYFRVVLAVLLVGTFPSVNGMDCFSGIAAVSGNPELDLDALTIADCKMKAMQGDKFAQFMVGEMYYFGQGVKEDNKEAAMWHMKAAKNGLSQAQHRIGMMYYAGEGFLQDYRKAAEWLTKAAEQNNGDAQAYLGRLYFLGDGVNQNNIKAYMYFNIASFNGSEIAKKMRPFVGEQMSPSQIEKAQDLSREWMREHP